MLIDYTDSDLLQDDPHRLQKDEGLHHQSYHGLRCKFMYSEKKKKQTNHVENKIKKNPSKTRSNQLEFVDLDCDQKE